MKKIQFIKYILATFGLLLVCTVANSLDLIKYQGSNVSLNDRQQHYFSEAMKSRFAQDANFANINFEVLGQRLLTINLPGGLNLIFEKEERTNVPLGRESWIGRIAKTNGAAHLTYKKNSGMLVGHIQFDDVCFIITPLTEGLHAIIRYDMSIDEGCMVPRGEFRYSGQDKAVKNYDYGNPDLISKFRDNIPEQLITGECNIRVLVAYTDDADALRADIYSDIVTMINTANTGYDNCLGLTYSIELAAAIRYNYTESGNMNTDLNCITNTSDGCLDDIHTQRALWDADQVALLTANGSGIGWVSTNFSSQFTVTGVGNFFSHTFHHELAHNAECTHALNQATQPGTAPYAGWGEPTTGCFRTVMAYPDACGTGTCPRHNIFSDDDVNSWNCGGTNYTPGTTNNRNQDRLSASKSIIVAHNTVGVNVSLSNNYVWNNKEGVHVAAQSTLSYNSASNNFQFNSGSHGSFRASDLIILGKGFLALSGSDFLAYIESCTALRTTDNELADLNKGGSLVDFSKFSFEIFPNPANQKVNISFTNNKESSYVIQLLDITGRLVKSCNGTSQIGENERQVDLMNIDKGIYQVMFIINDRREVKKLVVE